jgi:hypothetical protein
MIPLPVIFAVVSALAGASGAWLYQTNKFERLLSEQRNEYLKRDFKALEVAHADTIRLQATKDAALEAAAARNRELSRAAAAARSERDGLRDELAASRVQLPDASCASVREYASTLSEVFGQCTQLLTRVAEQADGHASDSLMLQESWPVNLPSKIE